MDDRKRVCASCGKKGPQEGLFECCGKIGECHDVWLRSLPLRHATMTINEVEILSDDFNTALSEAEGLVEKINERDFMLSPSIVSRSRLDARNGMGGGLWRFVVRTYGID